MNISNGIQLAIKLHGNQMRRGDEEPYVLHCIRVCTMVGRISNDINLLHAALLHDVVEDTNTTLEDLQNLKISKETLEMVKLLTKPKGVSREDYIKSIKESKNMAAIIIKIMDSLDNAIFSEKGKEFTLNNLKKDPNEESKKYLDTAKDLLGCITNIAVHAIIKDMILDTEFQCSLPFSLDKETLMWDFINSGVKYE